MVLSARMRPRWVRMIWSAEQGRGRCLRRSFCGEEGLEDVLHRLLVHAAAGVGDAQADVARPFLGDFLFREERRQLTARHDTAPDGQLSALGADGVDGVDADVQHHLLQLGRVAQNAFAAQLIFLLQLHVLPGSSSPPASGSDGAVPPPTRRRRPSPRFSGSWRRSVSRPPAPSAPPR